jgi:hypothetical protein
MNGILEVMRLDAELGACGNIRKENDVANVSVVKLVESAGACNPGAIVQVCSLIVVVAM